MSVFVYDYLLIPAGEFKIINSVEMLLNMKTFDSIECYKPFTEFQMQSATGRPVNFITPVKFVTCRKNAQGRAIFTFK